MTRNEAVAVAHTDQKCFWGEMAIATNIFQLDTNGYTLMYEVVFNNGTAVLVAGNKQCTPVIGSYIKKTDSSIFECKELPCGLKLFMKNYINQVAYCFSNPRQSSEHEIEWNQMIEGVDAYTNSDIGNVEPLINTHWRQSGSYVIDAFFSNLAGYNYYIESGGSCEHCKAGCVAVAMGQVMNYWKWPVLTADNWQFDWCNMPNRLDTSSGNYISERNAVARLLERCGYRAKMNYGCNGSESNVYKAKRALDEFGYNDDSDHRWRLLNHWSWEDDLRDNLDRGWPVIYGACGDPEIDWHSLFHQGNFINIPGHAFVCDGYQRDGKFHFNWGLASEYDGYFTVDSLCPGSSDYNLFNSAIFDLRPDGETSSYCDLSLTLEAFYNYYLISNPDSNVALYDITPRTFKELTSAPSATPASYRTIPSGTTAEYVAHKEIILQPGFTAEYGSDFTARIEPCAACEEQMIEMEMLSDEGSENIPDTISYEKRLFRSGDTVILAQPSNLHLYPNPTDNTLTVKSTEKIENIRILDNMGRPVFRWFIESNADGLLTLNVQNLPDGVYILQLTTSDRKSHLGRFVKK